MNVFWLIFGGGVYLEATIVIIVRSSILGTLRKTSLLARLHLFFQSGGLLSGNQIISVRIVLSVLDIVIIGNGLPNETLSVYDEFINLDNEDALLLLVLLHGRTYHFDDSILHQFFSLGPVANLHDTTLYLAISVTHFTSAYHTAYA